MRPPIDDEELALTTDPIAADVRFPDGFVWSSATASYQIEGATDEDGRGPSIWDTFSRTPGKVLNGDTGDVACDHYHRYAEDVALMRDLGVGAYRFSIAWPRVQPQGDGRIEPRGLDFYDRLVDELGGAGIRPVVTLYHWDLPQALQDRGGWGERDTAERFVDYARGVHERLGDRVQDWTTLNEPLCASYLGYYAGMHAPGLEDAELAFRAAHHLLLGHGMVINALRSTGGEDRFSIVLNLVNVLAEGDDAEATADAARRIDGLYNRMFLDPVLRGRYPQDVLDDVADITDFGFVKDGDLATIRAQLDYLGINYYMPNRIGPGPDEPTPGSIFPGLRRATLLPSRGPLTAMGWEQYPQGLYDVLTRVHRDYPGTPLFVMENGAAFDDVVS